MNASIRAELTPLASKIGRWGWLSMEEKAALGRVPFHTAYFNRRQEIALEGDRQPRCIFMLDGFSCSYKVSNSGRRQIIGIHFSGEMPDLASLHLPARDFGVLALTASKVAFVQHEALSRLTRDYPRIMEALWRDTLAQSALVREWILNVGRRPAVSRVAHLLCELVARLQRNGLATPHRCDLPLTQIDIADVTGLSTVHISRCLTELRTKQLIFLHAGRLEILNWPALKEVAEFDDGYLQFGDAKGAS